MTVDARGGKERLMKRLLAFVYSLTLVSATFAAGSFEDQVAEYLRRYPYQATYDYALRFTANDASNFNRWLLVGEPALIRAGEDVVPRTNNDTYYNIAVLDLKNGPVVLESSAPTRNRFNSFQLIDERNANYRNVVFPAGRYTLYFGDPPSEIDGEPIDVPSALSFAILRVEVRDKNDAADVAAAKTVFNAMTIRAARAEKLPALDLLSAFPPDVVAEANRRMDNVFARVPFRDVVVGPGKEPGRDVPYLNHAAGTKAAWGGPDPSHSSYEAIFFDEHGKELVGSNGAYTVTTDIPPVDGFWSVTVYDTERGGRLHPNASNRYHFNGTTAVENVDGTVTFTFKRACEATDRNCLEVPAGRFDVTARYFLPREPIVSGAWTFPKIENVGR
jgi:hypothetical protein